MKKLMMLSTLLVTAAVSSTVFADGMSGMKMSEGTMDHTTASGNSALTDAVIKHVDPASGMVTLKHGALTNVGMPAMTMAYKAGDASMLNSVKDGDNVKVRVENVGGTLTIVKMAKN
jgi:Cu/Ag efflux protein CusF